MSDVESLHGIQPRAKRRKIALACDPCRVRKAKCDGVQPICGPCQSRTHDKRVCQWADKAMIKQKDNVPEDFTNGIGREAVSSKSARSVNLPALAPTRPHDSVVVAFTKLPLPTSTTRNTNKHQATQSDISNCFSSNNDTHGNPSIHSNASPADLHRSRDVVNAMGAAPFSPEPPTVHSSAFYGGSSAAHFMNQVREGISRRGTQQLHASHLPVVPASAIQYAPSVPAETLEDIILPSRHFADQLMDVFWKESHTLYPFLHRKSMDTAFQNLWESKKAWQNPGSTDLGIGSIESSSSHTRIYQCALNAIFALSCQLAPPEMIQQDRHALSERFFTRCQDYLHIDILDQGSLALVQTLLIITQYLQSTHSPSRCWNSLGLACRIGQGLGLHVEDSAAKLDPTQVELRRRVWHGCNVMDIVTSMTLGRPTMTQQHNLPHPVSIWEEDFITYGDANTPQKVSILSSYMETINLYQILANVVTDIYKPWSPYSTQESSSRIALEQDNEMQTVLELADKLTKYSQGINRLLHWRTGSDLREQLPDLAQRAVQRQSNVLHARFLHVQILLHRPSFLRVCRRLVSSWEPNASGRFIPKEQIPSSFKSAIEVQSAVKCVTVAVELVTTLQLSIDKRNAGAWWYSMFYLYSAGMVLVLSKSCLPLQQEFDIASADQAWLNCCDILRSLQPYGQAPELGLESLLAMHDRLVLSSKPAHSTDDVPPEQEQQQNSFQQQPVRDFSTINDNTTGELDIPFDQQVDMFDVDLWSSRQPLMDFMTHDLDTMLPGMLDDYWWGVNQIGI